MFLVMHVDIADGNSNAIDSVFAVAVEGESSSANAAVARCAVNFHARFEQLNVCAGFE